MKREEREIAFDAEVRRISLAMWEALPTGVSYAALIRALGDILADIARFWSRSSVKCWRKPEPKETT